MGRGYRSGEGGVLHAGPAEIVCRDTDHLDVDYATSRTAAHPWKTRWPFGALTTEGLVRVAGCGNHAAWRVARAREIARAEGLPGFGCVQQRHIYLRPRPGVEYGANPHITGRRCEGTGCDAEPGGTRLATARQTAGATGARRQLGGQLDECLGALDLELDDELRHRLDNA
ncbi:aryl-alcohol dehydrogenase-like predicted oxidoreductase [Streptomyces sp. B4I13]|uniref:hypothetical protein n=1 Tax=Streptomyces sp. B4I13 TaxID=3042271 RepID=UPI0027881EB8|nr:hypothetical protein [Streptomyces sp. B4I13]MDQ0956489.1 aryl-alcohol dehydrogenase-like predicted oxidoreductase [Streptomyces sp. B4I13]